MCYYNGVKVTKQEFIRLRHLEKLLSKYDFLAKPYYDGFAYGNIPVIKKLDGVEDFEVTQMEWGFIPNADNFPFIETRQQLENFRRGYTDARGRYQKAYTTLNAVSEELVDKGKWFRDAALHRRCLVLSTGFYDWRHIHPIGKRGLRLKTTEAFPYHVKMKDTEVFFMAAVWQPWTDAETGEHVESVAIVTTAANSMMEQVHNLKKRMPTMLPEEMAYDWLLCDLTEPQIKEIAQYKIPSEKLEAYNLDKKFKLAEDPTVPFDYNNAELKLQYDPKN
jgi:putative SOS response-associated peptidase YedK